jgi:hypothetical protein
MPAALRAYAASQNVGSWGEHGPGVKPEYPAGGIEPGTLKGSDFYALGVRGDLEVRPWLQCPVQRAIADITPWQVATWRQLGSPEWPPMPRTKEAAAH